MNRCFFSAQFLKWRHDKTDRLPFNFILGRFSGVTGAIKASRATHRRANGELIGFPQCETNGSLWSGRLEKTDLAEELAAPWEDVSTLIVDFLVLFRPREG